MVRPSEQLPVDTEVSWFLSVRSMTKQESGSHKAQTCWVKCPFPVWQVLCLCVLIVLIPYQSAQWWAALNNTEGLSFGTWTKPFFAQHWSLYSPLNSLFRTHIHFNTCSSPLLPCNLSQDNRARHALLYHKAEASTFKQADWQAMLHQQRQGQCHSPQESRTSSTRHTHIT